MNSLPFKFNIVKEYENKLIISDESNICYTLYKISKDEIAKYQNLMKSKYVTKHIYGYKDSNNYYLLHKNSINKSDKKAVEKEALKALKLIYDEYKFKVTLRKEHFRILTNLYKLLDNKFKYIEMRIRELELAPIKNDYTWIILSKYHAILDCKVMLYDLQTDILKFIEKELVVEYGLVFRLGSIIEVENGLIEPNLDYYYAPLAMLYVRYYLLYEHTYFSDDFYDEIMKLSDFDKKYFSFMVLYIYVLN
ncbi:MAG: hypothetical protein J6R47_02500, partial [Acholeplasmatales bacterium]|nr:hypothetical protein [Acholeplasmatales bacterium]